MHSRTVSEAKRVGDFKPGETLIDDTAPFDPRNPHMQVAVTIPTEEELAAELDMRRLVITIEARGTRDEPLQPFIDRVLNVWMIRGGGEGGFVEKIDSDFDRRHITLSLQVAHEFVTE